MPPRRGTPRRHSVEPRRSAGLRGGGIDQVTPSFPTTKALVRVIRGGYSLPATGFINRLPHPRGEDTTKFLPERALHNQREILPRQCARPHTPHREVPWAFRGRCARTGLLRWSLGAVGLSLIRQGEKFYHLVEPLQEMQTTPSFFQKANPPPPMHATPPPPGAVPWAFRGQCAQIGMLRWSLRVVGGSVDPLLHGSMSHGIGQRS